MHLAEAVREYAKQQQAMLDIQICKQDNRQTDAGKSSALRQIKL